MKTTYMLLVMMAISLLSCNLEDELDKAIIDISGQVSHEGNSVAGVIVLLVEETGVSEGLNLANGSITDNSGHYTIFNVDPGEYYVLAVDDSDGNLQFDADTDRIGFHGVDPSSLDLAPDQISVTDEDVEDINIISLYSL